MYAIKSRIFLELSKTQKSALCNYLRALVKNNQGLCVEDLLGKFIEDETYYLQINSSRFEFLREIITDAKFLADAKLYLKECKKYYDYKKTQEPLKQAQKEFDKKKRKFLQEIKMSKELPTKKQISYYNSLCKRYGNDAKCLDELSKKDLRDLISEMVGNET